MSRPRKTSHDPARKQRRFRQRVRDYRTAKNGGVRRGIPPVAVPSFFTLMNLFSGFVAITQTLEGRFEFACWFIVLAGFFDLLDGLMARLTSSQSLFGVELDSLSDIVSFGVAPGFLVYVFGLREFGMLGLVVSSLPAICGAVRLARYNVGFDGDKKDHFEGIPIPGMAIAIVALILNIDDASWFNRYSMNNLSMLIPIVVVLSGLMVSNVRFEAVPSPSAAYVRKHPKKSVAYFLGMMSVFIFQQVGLLLSLAAYLLYGLGRGVYDLYHAIMGTSPEDDEQDGVAEPGA